MFRPARTLVATLAVSFVGSAFAGDVEVVGSGVGTISSGGADAAAYVDGQWHVVFARDGDIFHTVRTPSGWGPEEAISTHPAVAQAPFVATSGGRLHVVWEDERSGITEVWYRQHDGTVWGPEMALSADDGVRSRAGIVVARGARPRWTR